MAAALIVPRSRAFFDTVVCGLPLLTRAVCTFGRRLDTVYILRTPAVPDDFQRQLDAALAVRTVRPRVVWLQDASSLPSAGALFVLEQPAVFDPRLCAAIEALPAADERLVRCRRSPTDAGLVWFVGARHTPALVDALAHGEASPGEWLSHRPADDFDPGRMLCDRVEDARAQRQVERVLYAGTRKTTDTWIARNFDRHISAWITSKLLSGNATPTQITLVAFAAGVVGALLIALGSYAAGVLGSALLVASIIIDGCDGEIARLKFLETPGGRRLDFILDNVVNALTLFTVGVGHYFNTGNAFFLYAPMANATAALASAFPVYFLYYQHDSEPADTPSGPKPLSARVTEAVAGRDFMYMIFVLALFDRVYWFVYLTLGGIGFFLASVLFLLVTRQLGLQPRRPAVPRHQPGEPRVQVSAAADHAPKA
jgi:phosphatidylglycerophosphate synthase